MTAIVDVRVLDPHATATLVEIESDDGAVGIGLTQSASAVIRPIIEAGPGALRTYLIGRDPLDIDGLWRAMWLGWPGQYGRGSEGGLAANAMGALDIALWDLAGKVRSGRAYDSPAYVGSLGEAPRGRSANRRRTLPVTRATVLS